MFRWRLNVTKFFVNLLFLGDKLFDVKPVWDVTLVENIRPNGPDEFYICSPSTKVRHVDVCDGESSTNTPEYIPLGSPFNQLLLQVTIDWVFGKIPGIEFCDCLISRVVFDGFDCVISGVVSLHV